MKRIIVFVIVASMVLLSLASCSSGNDNTDSNKVAIPDIVNVEYNDAKMY